MKQNIAVNNGQFSSMNAPVVVNDAANWVEVGRIQTTYCEGYMVITGQVGAGGALGDLKITRAAIREGIDIDWITDFSIGTFDMPDSLPGSPGTTAANGTFQIKLHVGGAGEIAFWAKKAAGNTTLGLEGTVQPGC